MWNDNFTLHFIFLLTTIFPFFWILKFQNLKFEINFVFQILKFEKYFLDSEIIFSKNWDFDFRILFLNLFPEHNNVFWICLSRMHFFLISDFHFQNRWLFWKFKSVRWKKLGVGRICPYVYVSEKFHKHWGSKTWDCFLLNLHTLFSHLHKFLNFKNCPSIIFWVT